ncbi:MAG: peptidoglycan DD-metalloendopeptidase family protein [Spirochaetes bacterium]|nr:peptidoglycan DD-metalloendopeptidase family protein [Spirochaetota bacterium]
MNIRYRALFFFFFSFFPLSGFAGLKDIGVCGHPIFLKRQKAIDPYILRLKNSSDEYRKDTIGDLIKDFGTLGIENLIRYREHAVSEIFRKLIFHDDFYTKYKSLYGLKYTGKNSDARLLRSFVQNQDVLIRDMAFSAMGQLGTVKDIPFLEQMEKEEKNSLIKNSIHYAVLKIQKKIKPVFPDFPYGLSKTEPVQVIYYKSGDKIQDYREKYSVIFLYDRDIPQADTFCPPLIQYTNELMFSGKRVSFGAGDRVVHVGDDCGWFREGSSVFAIADGVVRLVHHSPDWGFLILIEHKLPDGKYLCSLYAHLSRDITVVPGQIVTVGEKIGEIGLSYSIDNGGYGAHLHFAISRGEWLKPGINLGKDLTVIVSGKELRVKDYTLTKEGIDMVYDDGIKVSLKQKSDDLSSYLFWIKGYEFARDAERIWIDPYEFLKKHVFYFP